MSPQQKGLPNPVPRHIAIIMDGNGRWAQKRGMPRMMGHSAGMKSVSAAIKSTCELGVEYLSLYAFSLQNWGRPKREVNSLMRLLREYLALESDNLVKNKIRLQIIGRPDRLPKDAQRALSEAVEKTGRQKKPLLTLTLAISYGAREEIVTAVRKMVSSSIKPGRIDEKTLERNLYTAGLPEPDLLIRTGGEMRLSNFLLWQCAYTEIYVTKTLWPDFGKQHIRRAINAYMRRERRFGLTSGKKQTNKNTQKKKQK